MNNVELVFSFDTTGSMSPVLGQVRRNVDDALAPLFKEVPNLRIGLCAHGDYCDAGRTYVTKWNDLTNNLFELTQFVKNTGSTGGGDLDECYELVLHEAQKLDWSINANKILVMIGDCNPHAPSYPMNTQKLDWRQELAKLKEMGIVVYSVQCLSRSQYTPFYRELAEKTGGYHFQLDQFNDIVTLIKAITLKQGDPSELEAFEKKLVSSNKMNRSLDRSFSILSGRKESSRYVPVSSGLNPVAPGRFQILGVDHDVDIRGFVESNDLEFMPGKGFYELTKAEDVQEKKEVVLRDKTTGDMFSGVEARNLIGIPMGTRGRVHKNVGATTKYDVFIQSTSYNRKLKGGTNFLYEVNMER